MKYYIELESIKQPDCNGGAINDFIDEFRARFGDRLELTMDNLKKLDNRKWNLPYCLCSIIPEGIERDEFIKHRGYQTIYEPLKKYCGKWSLVDKIVKSAYQ